MLILSRGLSLGAALWNSHPSNPAGSADFSGRYGLPFLFFFFYLFPWHIGPKPKHVFPNTLGFLTLFLRLLLFCPGAVCQSLWSRPAFLDPGLRRRGFPPLTQPSYFGIGQDLQCDCSDVFSHTPGKRSLHFHLSLKESRNSFTNKFVFFTRQVGFPRLSICTNVVQMCKAGSYIWTMPVDLGHSKRFRIFLCVFQAGEVETNVLGFFHLSVVGGRTFRISTHSWIGRFQTRFTCE